MVLINSKVRLRMWSSAAAGVFALYMGLGGALSVSVQAATLDITRATISDVQQAYATGRLSAERVTQAYLARIAAYEEDGPAINAIIHMNPDALAQAKALDAERKAGRVRGPLHGIPVVLKDNFDTYDLPTTAGSQLLAGSIPSKDGFVSQRLREAGVVIIAKVNMTEFANSGGKVPLGYSSGGGQTDNPHGVNRSPGSSSGGTGSAVAAAFAQFGLGTDSQGSVRGPAAANGVTGIKTTHGLISKSGVIPLTLSLDTVGTMARNVTDLAISLGAMVGIDPADEDTLKSVGRYEPDYAPYLKADALKGARIGIARQFMGADAEIDKVVEDAIEVLRQQGAVIVDQVKFPEYLLEMRGPIWPFLEASEFRADITDYLGTLKPGFPKNFDEIVALSNDPATNFKSPEKAELFKSLSERAMDLDDPTYIALTNTLMPAFTVGVESVFEKYNVTAMFFPTSNRPTPNQGPREPRDSSPSSSGPLSATSIASQSGYPEIVVPAGMTKDEMPIAVSFLGRAWSEGQLISLAYAFEQATQAIRMPKFTPGMKTDVLRY